LRKGLKQIKLCKIELKYNYSIIKDFSSKTPSTIYPTQGSCHILFLEKEKTEEDNKNISSFSVYSSYRLLPNNENNKKKNWSRKD